MPEQSSPPESARQPEGGRRPAAPPTPPADAAAHPTDAAHDLSDSPADARSPEEYTEEPGSHRRGADGPALDVGG